jgi:sec-independent protein translocase protein TatA
MISSSRRIGAARRWAVFKNFGWGEILIVLAVLFLLFGATRLPQIGKSLGSGIRQFRKGLSGTPEDESTRAQRTSSNSEPSKPAQH